MGSNTITVTNRTTNTTTNTRYNNLTVQRVDFKTIPLEQLIPMKVFSNKSTNELKLGPNNSF